MKILIFSDIHSNVDNIIEVFNETKFDEYIFAGDFFGYFLGGKKVLELMLEFKVKFILGNHDLYFLREIDESWFNSKFSYLKEKMISSEEYNNRYGYFYESIEEIKQFNLDFLKKADLSANFLMDDLNIKVCHGSPVNTFNEYVYPDYEFFDEIFLNNDFDILILGHTHKSYIERKGNRFIINPGSCTIPRGKEVPTYVVFDTDKLEANVKVLDQKINFIRETKSKLKLV